MSSEKYQAGQVWEYETRPHETASLLYIAHVDQVEGYGSIYHIYLTGLEIENPNLPGGIQTVLPHAPVDSTTLNQSVTKLREENAEMPDISEGYAAWKEPFDQGEAGVFNIPVHKIVGFIEQVVTQAPQQQ